MTIAHINYLMHTEGWTIIPSLLFILGYILYYTLIFLKKLYKIYSRKGLFFNTPGKLYVGIGQLLLTRKTYEKIMEPSILDMQEEYFDALQAGRNKFAAWVKIRFFFIFLQVLGLNLPLIRNVVSISHKLASK